MHVLYCTVLYVPIEKSALWGPLSFLCATELVLELVLVLVLDSNKEGVGDLDHSNTSSSLLHSVTVSEIGISVLGTGDSVRHGVTDSSTTALVSALRRVEGFVFVSYSFNAEDFCVCVSVCCSEIKVSVFTDLFCLFLFFPLNGLDPAPVFLSSPPFTLDEENEEEEEEDEDKRGDCATDGWEACPFCEEDVFAMSVSACFSSTLLSRLYQSNMLH